MRNLFGRVQQSVVGGSGSPRQSVVDRSRSATPTWGMDGASDPGTWIEAFGSHWQQAHSIMAAAQRGLVTDDHVQVVFKHLDQMSFLLLTEINAQPVPTIGPIMDKYFVDDIMRESLQFCMAAPNDLQLVTQANLLRLYEGLITQAHTHHSLLVHKPFLTPLLKLLDWCHTTSLSSVVPDGKPKEVEKHFVLLLYQICIKISQHNTLLEFFFNTPATPVSKTTPRESDQFERDNENEQATPRFLVFTLLIAYIYEQGDIGQLARDAILLILSVSRNVSRVGQFIGEYCEFCPVLATGLSGLFSELPRRLLGELMVADDWRRITSHDIEMLPSLMEFHAALLFVNAVVQMFQVGQSAVLNQLLDYLYNGFLVSVVQPALFESGLEELISATAYLELCFRTVTEKALLRTLLKFLIVESEGETRLIDALVGRIASNTKLCLVSLALFDTLLSLHCEDLMIELVFKYLMPCTHVMASQVSNVGDIDTSGHCTAKLLSLVPRCCPLDYHLQLSSSTDVTDTHDALPGDNALSTFYDYLRAARCQVEQTYTCSRCWVFPYDGRVPDPYNYRDEQSITGSPSDAESTSLSLRSPFGRSSMRRSARRFNSYFARRHTSLLTSSGIEPSSVDLTVLGAEFLSQEEDVDELSYIDRLLLQTHHDGSDGETTPHYRRSAPNYFQLAYDEGSTSGEEKSGEGVGVAQKQSAATVSAPSSNGQDGYNTDATSTSAESFVLTGWAQLDDMHTFTEALDSVRPSHDSCKHSLDENLAFLDERYEKLIQSQSSTMGDCGLGTEPAAAQDEHADNDQHSAHALFVGVPIECSQSIIAPQLGPFLTCLLAKLDTFVENGLYVNLQLTGLICKVASHPQPLIASFFFNPSLVFQPTVRSVWQILAACTQKVDALAFAADGFGLMLDRGWKFMLQRDKRYAKEVQKSMRPRPAAHSPVPTLEKTGFTSADADRPRSISDIFMNTTRKLSKTGKDERAQSDSLTDGQHKAYRFYQHKALETQSATLDTIRTKNVVYCAIVLREFCQELAAISLEQAAVRGYVDVTKFL